MLATPAPPAGFAPRRANPHPNPGLPQLPVRLARQATPAAGLAYNVVSYWEERLGDSVRRDTLTRTLTVHAQPDETGHWNVACELTAPALQKTDPSALEQVLLLLAGLYQRVVLRLTPDGRSVALLNHAELLDVWESLKQELVRRSGGGTDDLTQLLLTDLDAKLQDPAAVLASLRYDYLYDTLLANHYQQRFEHGWRYEQPRRFVAFFAEASLCLTERLTVDAPPAAGQVALRADGGLDPTRTDRVALARSIDAAWAATEAAPDRPPTDPAAVHAAYDAAYAFEAASGWPTTVELSVRCHAGADYHKEYFLRLEQSL